ncbi:MAG: hypothetical protein H6608_05465 [Flavobacteriales bacterium]|nr:hypothetical protein [Bacteroidota bacterium]MCB9240554.1 hypothetical protein [Flavobacteriales bacterium]
MKFVQRLKRTDIDTQRWDTLVTESGSLPYALSWYLDEVTQKNWEALVYQDYEAALPVPVNTKIAGYKQAYRPIFSQQYHVIGFNVDPAVTAWILQFMHRTYRRVNYPLAVRSAKSLNDCPFEYRECTDLIIPLNRKYDQIEQNYSKSLKKRLRKSDDLQVIEGADVQGVIDFYRREVGPKSGLSAHDFQVAAGLFAKCQSEGILRVYEVMDASNRLNAMGFFLDFNGRLINIFGASNSLGREHNAMHVVIDQLLKSTAESHKFFDFEGSDVMGVREFFQSFGPEYQPYYTLHSNRLPEPINWLYRMYDRKRRS